MSKILLLVLAAFVIWLLLKRLRRKDATKVAPEPASEQMVTCGHCGLYLPQKEAIVAGGEFFCCAEHQRRSG